MANNRSDMDALYVLGDREYYPINKPLLIFSPYKKFNGELVSGMNTFQLMVDEMNKAAAEVADPQENSAINRLIEKLDKAEDKGERYERILYSLNSLFELFNAYRMMPEDRDNSFYYDMVFYLSCILRRAYSIIDPYTGAVFPDKIGAYIMGLGNDEDDRFYNLCKFVAHDESLQNHFEHSYAMSTCIVLELLKKREITKASDQKWFKSEIIRYVDYMIRLEALISNWIDGELYYFKIPAAYDFRMALRSQIIWHYKFLAKNGLYLPREIQRIIYERYLG